MLLSYAASVGALLYPSDKFFFWYDHAVANLQHWKAFFMHQLIAAGGGDAQHLSDHSRVEEQRQVIVSFVDGLFPVVFVLLYCCSNFGPLPFCSQSYKASV